MKRYWAMLFLFCLLSFGCSREMTVSQIDTEELRKELNAANCSDSERLEDTENLFSRYRAPMTKETFGGTTNLSTYVKGETNETIIVGAHFDKTEKGCGAVDNWTGIVMLARIYESLSARTNKKSYRVVAFDDEEKGLLGSELYADGLEKIKGQPVCAMVNLDSFGFERTWALKGISTRGMLMLAAAVERERGGSFSIKSDRGASSDSKPFKDAGIPAITFSGLGVDWRKYLHTENDKAEYIDVVKVAESLDFVQAFLQKIDETPCLELRK